MANPDHVKMLVQRAQVWNDWRNENSFITPDLRGFYDKRYDGTRSGYVPRKIENTTWELGNQEHGFKTDFRGYDLSNSLLDSIDFRKQDLSDVKLMGSSMVGCNLKDQYLFDKNLKNVDLLGANLKNARIINSDLSGSNLKGSDLRSAKIENCNLSECDLSQTKAHGISLWDVDLNNSNQFDIIITRDDQSIVKVDNLKVAQFVYLLLDKSEIRDVVDTITAKAVLILGRFTETRINILYSIRDLLREQGYLPIVFDFNKPESRDTTESIITLAHLSKFIIADLSEPKSVPHELAHIIPTLEVAVKPIIVSEVNGEEQKEYGMFKDLQKYPWVLDIYRYEDEKTLLDGLNENVINPAVSYQKNK